MTTPAVPSAVAAAIWGSRPAPRRLADPRTELHRQTVGVIAHHAHPQSIGSDTYLDGDAFTFVRYGSPGNSVPEVARLSATLAEHGYTVTATETRNDGTRVAVDATDLPRGVYERLSENSRSAVDILFAAAPEHDWAPQVRLDEQAWANLAKEVATQIVTGSVRGDVMAILHAWSKHSPKDALSLLDKETIDALVPLVQASK
jgi:hypothetical protein